MGTPTVPKNQDRVWRKIISLLQSTSKAGDDPVGSAASGRMKRKSWIYAGTPDTAATGQLAGDLVLDATNDEVYRYVTGNVFVQVTTATA